MKSRQLVYVPSSLKGKVNHRRSEIEHAITHHIDVNIDDDPEYYKSLSEKLKNIIKRHHEHWDELVQLLLEFRENIERDHEQQADELGLSNTEFASHNILMAEVALVQGESTDSATQDEVIAVTKDLVDMFNEAIRIVDFFSKQDEVKRMKKAIKRRIIDASFDDSDLRKVVMDRFMELAKHKFKT